MRVKNCRSFTTLCKLGLDQSFIVLTWSSTTIKITDLNPYDSSWWLAVLQQTSWWIEARLLKKGTKKKAELGKNLIKSYFKTQPVILLDIALLQSNMYKHSGIFPLSNSKTLSAEKKKKKKSSSVLSTSRRKLGMRKGLLSQVSHDSVSNWFTRALQQKLLGAVVCLSRKTKLITMKNALTCDREGLLHQETPSVRRDLQRVGFIHLQLGVFIS